MCEKAKSDLVSGADLGWNDPPMFSYDSRPQAASSKKPSLTKRVGLSWSATPSPSQAPPPSSPALSPPKCSVTVKPPVHDAPVEPSSTDESELSWDTVSERFKRVTDELYAEKEKDKSEVDRRLHLIETMWKENKLTLDIQEKLNRISLALVEGRTEDGDVLQRSLMVDYPSICSPWMAAIRKLLSSKKESLPTTSS